MQNPYNLDSYIVTEEKQPCARSVSTNSSRWQHVSRAISQAPAVSRAPAGLRGHQASCIVTPIEP